MHEPIWSFHKKQLDRNPSLKSWLMERNSMTKRLKNNSRSFHVEIVNLFWGKPLFSEARCLKIPNRSRVFIREVKLTCDFKEWIFARVIIPRSSFVGRQNRKLLYLDVQPLGELLFQDPGLQRSKFEFTLIKSAHHYHKKLKPKKPELWARRSTFYFHNKPLLVTEIFLDDFPYY